MEEDRGEGCFGFAEDFTVLWAVGMKIYVLHLVLFLDYSMFQLN